MLRVADRLDSQPEIGLPRSANRNVHFCSLLKTLPPLMGQPPLIKGSLPTARSQHHLCSNSPLALSVRGSLSTIASIVLIVAVPIPAVPSIPAVLVAIAAIEVAAIEVAAIAAVHAIEAVAAIAAVHTIAFATIHPIAFVPPL